MSKDIHINIQKRAFLGRQGNANATVGMSYDEYDWMAKADTYDWVNVSDGHSSVSLNFKDLDKLVALVAKTKAAMEEKINAKK